MYDVLNAYLENGLKIVMHKIADAKTVACGLWIHQGSVNETDENNGISHLVEHLLLNSANDQCGTYQRLMDEVASQGAIYNAVTTKEYTCFYYTGLPKTLYLCLQCLACIAKDKRIFPTEFFEKEKQVVLQEAISFYSSFQQIKERTSQALWGNMGSGRIIMGDIANIQSAKTSQVYDIINSAYVPENATLIVIGNMNYQEICFRHNTRTI